MATTHGRIFSESSSEHEVVFSGFSVPQVIQRFHSVFKLPAFRRLLLNVFHAFLDGVICLNDAQQLQGGITLQDGGSVSYGPGFFQVTVTSSVRELRAALFKSAE